MDTILLSISGVPDDFVEEMKEVLRPDYPVKAGAGLWIVEKRIGISAEGTHQALRGQLFPRTVEILKQAKFDSLKLKADPEEVKKM